MNLVEKLLRKEQDGKKDVPRIIECDMNGLICLFKRKDGIIVVDPVHKMYIEEHGAI